MKLSTGLRRRWTPVVSICLALVLAACQGTTPPPPRLEEAPPPPLDRFDAEVRRQLAESIETAEELTRSPIQSREQAAQACARLGRLYLAYELPDAAWTSFKNASVLDPESLSSEYYLGVISQSRGDLEEAAKRLRQVVQAKPGDLAAWIRLADVELERGRLDGAESAFQKALLLSPTCAAAHFGLGRLAAQRGQQRAAVEHFDKALQFQPAATQIHYPLAQSYRKLGDLEKARLHLTKRGEATVSFPDPLLSELATLTVGAPGHAHRADQAVLEGRLREAAQEYRQAVSLAPGNYYYRKSLALTEYRVGDSEAAIHDMEEAIQLSAQPAVDSPSIPAKELSQAHFTLGGMLANKGDSESALQQFQESIQLDPAHLEAHFQMGRLSGQAGRLPEALRHFMEVLRQDPNHVQANRLAATTCMDLGRFREAIPYLRRLAKLEPENERNAWLLKVATERAGQ